MTDLPMKLTAEQKAQLDAWLADPQTPSYYKAAAEANTQLAQKINKLAILRFEDIKVVDFDDISKKELGEFFEDDEQDTTDYLLSDTTNRDQLLASIKRLDEGKGIYREPIEPSDEDEAIRKADQLVAMVESALAGNTIKLAGLSVEERRRLFNGDAQ